MSVTREEFDALKQRIEVVEAHRPVPGPRGPAGDISAAVGNAEAAAKQVVIARLDEYVQRADSAVSEAKQQVGNVRKEFQTIVNNAVAETFNEAFENQVAALVLKLLVEYQVADLAGDPIKID